MLDHAIGLSPEFQQAVEAVTALGGIGQERLIKKIPAMLEKGDPQASGFALTIIQRLSDEHAGTVYAISVDAMHDLFPILLKKGHRDFALELAQTLAEHDCLNMDKVSIDSLRQLYDYDGP